MEILHAVSAVITFAVLLSASVSDWRKREVSDIHWIILFLLGTVMLISTYHRNPIVLIPAVTMFILISFDLVWERESSAKAEALIFTGTVMSAICVFRLSWGSNLALSCATVLAIYILMNVLYYTGIVKGGADAKSIIAISMVFPIYSSFGGLPMITTSSELLMNLFPPAIVVFIVADIFTLLLIVYYAVRNLRSGDTLFPQMFIGYVKRLSSVDPEKEWVIQDIENGELVFSTRAAEDGAIERLKEANMEKVWITPIIPFIIPITLAYAFVLLIGNPFFLIV